MSTEFESELDPAGIVAAFAQSEREPTWLTGGPPVDPPRWRSKNSTAQSVKTVFRCWPAARSNSRDGSSPAIHRACAFASALALSVRPRHVPRCGSEQRQAFIPKRVRTFMVSRRGI